MRSMPTSGNMEKPGTHNRKRPDIFERLKSGEPIPMDDPDYGQIREAVNETIKLSVQLNSAEHVDEVRVILSKIIGAEIDESTTIFPPFHTNFGRHISLGKNIFINHACRFLDLGGITIEDGVMIGPRVKILSEDHPVAPSRRKTLLPGRVLVKQNAWIGAAATLMPGITIGENSVVAAGAVVTKDVPPNVVVAGVPARPIREL